MEIFKTASKSTLLLVLPTLLAGTVFMGGCNRAESPEQAHTQAQAYLERAAAYKTQGQYRAAIIETSNALKQNPRDRAVITYLASIYNELGQSKPAIQLMTPLAADANRNEALTLAQAYFLQRKYQSSIDYLAANSDRLNLANDDAANLLRTRAQLRLGQFDTAQPTLERMSQSNVIASIDLARLMQQRGNKEQSAAHIAALLGKNPENVDVLSEAALRAEQQGDLSRAEDLLSKALINLPQTDILLPQKSEVLQRLVTTLGKLGRSNEALAYSKALTDANPEGTLLQDKFQQGVELFEAGKLDEAEAILTEVFNESHHDAVGTLLGMIRYAKNDFSGAANYLNANVDTEVASDSALTALAVTQLRLAQPEKLLTQFNAAARARITNPNLKVLVGIALLQTGATSEGEKLITQAQAEQPANNAIRGTLARYYLTNSQADKAIVTLEAGLKLQPDPSLSRLLIAAYASAEQPDRALKIAQQLASSEPAQAENWWVLGRTALQLQKPDIAESALRKALAHQQNYLPAQLDLAQLHLTRKQPDQAEALYKTVLLQHPDNLGGLKGLVSVFAQRSASGEALEKHFLEVTNTDNARAILAEYYIRLKQFDLAERLIQTIPASNMEAYPARIKEALILAQTIDALQARNFDTARNHAVDGLKINPRNPELLLLLARVEIGANKLEEAKKVAAQLNQTLPHHPGVLELRGDLAMLEKLPKVAADHYRSAWGKVRNNTIATKLYQSLSADQLAANQFLSEWQQRLPSSDTPWFFRGLTLQQAADNNAAIAAYETAVRLNPNNPQALNNLAWLYGESGDKRALATAEKAATISPSTPAVLDTYGWLLVKNGQKEKGLTQLRNAARLAPASKEIQAHLTEATVNNQ